MEKSYRGFASMPKARVQAIAAKGGKSVHAQGRAHQYTPEEAKIAGQRGGIAVSQDRAHMAEIGRRGGRVVSKDRAHMAEIGRIGGTKPVDEEELING